MSLLKNKLGINSPVIVSTGEFIPSELYSEEELNQILSDVFGIKITHREDNNEEENCNS